MNLLQFFGYKQLPVWDAPAINNAYVSALSKPPVPLAGPGRVNRGAFRPVETAIYTTGPQAATPVGFDGAGNVVWSSFGSQPLSDPKANKKGS